MSKHAYYQILETNSKEEALKLITFPIVRASLYYKLNGIEEKINEEIIIREDTKEPFTVVSSTYQTIKHEEALNLMFEAFENLKIPFELKSVGIDSAGSKMICRFQILQDYEITEGDTIRPEIVLINGYDRELGFGIDIGFFRKNGLTICGASEYKIRWFNSNKLTGLKGILKELKRSVNMFEEKMVLHYKKMAKRIITSEDVVCSLISSAKKDVLPKKEVKKAIAELLKVGNKNLNMWEVFNLYCNIPTNLVNEISPSRMRELYHNIVFFFKKNNPLTFLISNLEYQKWTNIKKTKELLEDLYG